MNENTIYSASCSFYYSICNMNTLKLLTTKEIKLLSHEQLLELLTPDQIKLLSCVSHERLITLMNCGKNKIPKLKSLVLSLGNSIDAKEHDNNVVKILEILCEYSDQQFYVICTPHCEVNYKIFTKNELLEFVPEHIIDKLRIDNINKIIQHPNGNYKFKEIFGDNNYHTTNYDTTIYHKAIYNRIVNKVNNLHILSGRLLYVYGYFQQNNTIRKFIDELSVIRKG